MEVKPPKLSEFEDNFYQILERIQAATNHIDKAVDVQEAFGILRTLRKSNAGHVINMEIEQEGVERFNQ